MSSVTQFLIQGSDEDKLQRAEWLLNKATGELKERALGMIARHWSAENPEGAFQWLEQQSANNKDDVKAELIHRIMYKDVALAMQKFETLESESNRERLSFMLYKHLQNSNPQQAEVFLNDSPYRPTIEERLEKVGARTPDY